MLYVLKICGKWTKFVFHLKKRFQKLCLVKSVNVRVPSCCFSFLYGVVLYYICLIFLTFIIMSFSFLIIPSCFDFYSIFFIDISTAQRSHEKLFANYVEDKGGGLS